MEVVLPLHPEFFGSPTHVTPKAVFKVTLREVIVLPTLKKLEGIVILLPWKDRSMPTTLGQLKKSWLASNTSQASPRPLPSKLKGMAQPS